MPFMLHKCPDYLILKVCKLKLGVDGANAFSRMSAPLMAFCNKSNSNLVRCVHQVVTFPCICTWLKTMALDEHGRVNKKWILKILCFFYVSTI